MLEEDVEPVWRENLRQNYNSVWHNIPLDTDKEHYPDRPWQFYTDLDTIYAEIHDEEKLQSQFENVVSEYWNEKPEELAQETLHYLLFHELYHPLEAPSSRQDAKYLHQAMRRGLLRAEPDLSPKEQVQKVRSAQNAVKDFILDNRFYVDNQKQGYVQEDILPSWDVMELDEKDPRPDMYTITRVLYGSLYGPSSTHQFFAEKAGTEGVTVAEQTMEAMIDQDVDLPTAYLDPDREEDRDTLEQLGEFVEEMYTRFQRKSTRYQAVEEMMAVLGPYVKEDMPGARRDLAGVSTEQNVLEDLLDDMGESEQDDFLDDLMDDLDQDGEGDSDDGTGTGMGRPDTDTDVGRLQVSSYHEFYRENHPRVIIRGGDKTGESVEAGTRDYLDVTKQQVVNKQQLSRLDMQAIARAHKRGLPVLVPTGQGLYRVFEYEEREEVIQDVRHHDQSLSVPDTIDFYIDSSGSMFEDDFYPGDDSRYDMLNHVLYGMVDALRQTEEELGERVSLRLHNFASSQVSSSNITVDEFWDGDINMLNTLYRPNNGGDTKALDIQQYNDGKERTHIVISDGKMDNSSSQVSKMQDRRKSGEHTILIEMGGTYNLGEKVEENGLPYRQVHEKEEMLDEGLSLLLSP